MRSNKNIRKTRSRTHGGDRKARPITNHDRRRTREVWGSDKGEDTASGVVWKEAPESAIHSVLTGVVRPMALKDCANRGALAANGAAAGGIPNAGLAAAREAVAREESLGGTACAAGAAGATAAT